MTPLNKILILAALLLLITGCASGPPGIPTKRQTHAILDITLYAGDNATLDTSLINDTYWVNIT
jgi:hypothetical protein